MIIPKPPKKKGRHRQTKECDISPKVRARVQERDGGKCVICGCNRGIPNCHYIARSHGGLGVEQNIVSACIECHHDYDNGDKREEYGEKIEEYLKRHYPNWDKETLYYNKNYDMSWEFDKK